MTMWTLMAAMLAASAPAAGSAAPVEVMVVGTYHFDNPGRDLNNMAADDVTKPQRQAELEAIAAALAEWRPTKVLVERQPRTADLSDPAFADFTAAALASDRNEIVQIGYRLARRLGHSRVYAIDEQPGPGEPDYFPFGRVAAWAEANGRAEALAAVMAKGAALTAEMEKMQKSMTIGGILLERNRPAVAVDEQGIYYEIMGFGDAEDQPGPELNALWYMRNAKIFGKLRQVAEPGDRLLVVYGSGHTYWLRHFAETTPGYVSVDPVPYLEKAAGK